MFFKRKMYTGDRNDFSFFPPDKGSAPIIWSYNDSASLRHHKARGRWGEFKYDTTKFDTTTAADATTMADATRTGPKADAKMADTIQVTEKDGDSKMTIMGGAVKTSAIAASTVFGLAMTLY